MESVVSVLIRDDGRLSLVEYHESLDTWTQSCGGTSHTRVVPRKYGHVETVLVVECLALVECHESLDK